MVSVGRLLPRDRERHGESSGVRDEQDTTRGLILRCIAVLHTIFLSRMVRRLWGWLVQSLQRLPSAASRSTTAMKAISSSTDWNRVAFPDTTCSTRPVMHPVSKSVSRLNWTTNARVGANAGLCSSGFFIGELPYARMRLDGQYCALQVCELWR